jgi:hypothetical protein
MICERLQRTALALGLLLKVVQMLGEQITYQLRGLELQGQHAFGGEDAQQQLRPMLELLRTRESLARQQDGSYRWVFQRLDRLRLLAHLQGTATFALASRDELGQCHWVCLDSDAPDRLDHLRLVQQALEEHGQHSLLQGSRRGVHPWLFFSLPQPASLATSVVQGVLDPLYDSRHLPHVLEVYPDHTELGHAVRMPPGIHRRTGQRYPFLDEDGTPLDLEDLPRAMAFALALPAIRPEQLRAIAATLIVVIHSSRISLGDSSVSSLPLPSSTTSGVIRWMDAQVIPLNLLEELAPRRICAWQGRGISAGVPSMTTRRPTLLEIQARYRSMSSTTAATAGVGGVCPLTVHIATARCATVSASFTNCSISMWSARSALR